MTRRFPIAPALVAVIVALAVAAVAAAGWRSDPQADSPGLTLASKQLHLVQTQANRALIRLTNAKPGQVAQGRTEVTTSGTPATVRVRANNLRDLPGPNGGKLIASRRLWIVVRCVAIACLQKPIVYRGPLALMGAQNLGTWRPGTHRTYDVRVWLLRGGVPPTTTTGDNLFQHSTARFGLLWTATAN